MSGRFVSTIAAALLVVAGARAQSDPLEDQDERMFPPRSAYEKVNMTKVEKYFASSLDYQIDGILESALANIVLVQLAQPDYNSAVLREKIINLSLSSESASVRRKAYLAALVLGAPALFTTADIPRTSIDELFRAIAARVQETLQAAQ